MLPTGFEHGEIECNLAVCLKLFLRSQNLGKVLTGEVGIYIRRDPDSIRAADLLFISHERLRQVRSTSYLDVAPELVVKVLSPGDSWSETAEKMEDYFFIGVQQVWLADPRRKTLHMFRAITDSTLLRTGDPMPDIPFLPGFYLNLDEIFG